MGVFSLCLRASPNVIRVTRLNGLFLTLNSDLIKFVEQAPDTVITLTNGEKLIVRESEEEVIQLIREFRRSMMVPPPAGIGPQVPSSVSQKASTGPEVQRRG